MKAVVIQRAGEPVSSNVTFESDFAGAPTGKPGQGEAVVRTLAAALDHMDLWVGKGVPGLTLAYPRVSGCDACGVVEAVGEGVDGSWVGRRVILNAAIASSPAPSPDHPPLSTPQYELIGEHRHGTLRERFIAPVANLATIGDGQSPAESAAFGLTFLTAYSMMVGKAGLRPGQSVLVTGIGGGVALAALAIARHWGCRVVVTSRHRWKLERAVELGADGAILDEGQDWSKEARKWTGGRGVDLAVDSSGKATHLKCIKSLARGGTYATPGCTSGPDATTDLARVFWNQLRILGSTMGTNSEFAEVCALFRSGLLKPVVDSVHKAERAAEAFARLESGEQFGKVVVEWGQ